MSCAPSAMAACAAALAPAGLERSSFTIRVAAGESKADMASSAALRMEAPMALAPAGPVIGAMRAILRGPVPKRLRSPAAGSGAVSMAPAEARGAGAPNRLSPEGEQAESASASAQARPRRRRPPVFLLVFIKAPMRILRMASA